MYISLPLFLDHISGLTGVSVFVSRNLPVWRLIDLSWGWLCHSKQFIKKLGNIFHLWKSQIMTKARGSVVVLCFLLCMSWCVNLLTSSSYKTKSLKQGSQAGSPNISVDNGINVNPKVGELNVDTKYYTHTILIGSLYSLIFMTLMDDLMISLNRKCEFTFISPELTVGLSRSLNLLFQGFPLQKVGPKSLLQIELKEKESPNFSNTWTKPWCITMITRVTRGTKTAMDRVIIPPKSTFPSVVFTLRK